VPPLPAEEFLPIAEEVVRDADPASVHETIVAHHEVTLIVDRTNIVEIIRRLKTDERTRLNALVDVNAIDWFEEGRVPRFDVVYHLFSYFTHNRLRLRCPVSEAPGQNNIDSICELWSGANFMERETFDMFGIVFNNHPDLCRILMPDNWEGHPLRKDFPLGGSESFYYKQDTHEYAGEPNDLVPRIRVQESDI
jgi:NADH-quinone oxidoreductase subunit C